MSTDRPLPLEAHLRELGVRLRRVAIAFFIGFLLGWLPAPEELSSLLNPHKLFAALFLSEYKPLAASLFKMLIVDILPPNVHVTTLGLLTPLEVVFSFCVVLGAATAFPVLLYEIYMFVKPGLHPHEQRAVKTYLTAGSLLFVLGMVFGYEVIFRALVRLYSILTPWFGLEPLVLARNVVNELVGAVLFSGLLFETPVAMVLLTQLDLASPRSYTEYRPVVYAIAIILICLFNPDPTFLSSLIWISIFVLLYEIGVVLSKRVAKKREDTREIRLGWSYSGQDERGRRVSKQDS